MSSTPRTLSKFSNVVKALLPFLKKKEPKFIVLKGDRKENAKRSETERDISKISHEPMRKAQLELYGSGGKRKQPSKPKSKTKKKPASKTNKSTKK